MLDLGSHRIILRFLLDLSNPALTDKFSSSIDLCVSPILLPFCAIVTGLGFLGDILEILSKTKNVKDSGWPIKIDLRGEAVLFGNSG